MVQVISVVGSMLILVAYVASLFGRVNASSLTYLLLNFVGSGILAVIALLEHQWGFLLLEGVWAVVSLWSLAQMARGRAPEVRH